jgi:hypothetical protein
MRRACRLAPPRNVQKSLHEADYPVLDVLTTGANK